jgi:caffeoyl-CoA O-methyltransferase
MMPLKAFTIIDALISPSFRRSPVPLSTATIAVPHPARYLRLLTARLEQEAPVEHAADGRATITFGQGTCVLTPARGLGVIAAAADGAALAGLRDILTRHLRRCADGEDLEITWTEPVSGADMQITDPVIGDYLLRHCTGADGILGELVAVTREAAGTSAGMQTSADEGAFLTMLTRIVDARYAVEVGVFTGYSSICIARGLAAGGRLLACDTSDEWTSVARRYWQRAGVADRIDLRIGPAIETLRALPAEQRIDIAFIDADKSSYPAYYEEIVSRLRHGGLVVLDNVFLGGRVLDPAYQEEHHQVMRRLNDLITTDDRMDSVMLPLRDGITIARKR